MKEIAYIWMRQIQAWGNRMIFCLCRIFPIRKNRVCITTFEGKGGFGCNPKYIVQELHKQRPEYEFIWMVKDCEKKFPAYIKKVPYTLWSRAYYLSTSKIWLNNYRSHYGTVKRKGQFYLNTNHYTEGIKCTGLWRGKGFSRMAYLVSKADSDMIDALLIDSAWCETVMPKAMLFTGQLWKVGSPRCDILYGDRSGARRRIREKYKLPMNTKIVMYAPTFREGSKNGKRSVYLQRWSIDFKRLLVALERKFAGDWYLCIRVHPQLASTFSQYSCAELKGKVFDESQADDMYDILAGMDFYITDYSSAVFEAGFAGIPAIIYADDIEQYANDRGDLWWDLPEAYKGHVPINKQIRNEFPVELPFRVVWDNDGLTDSIEDFDINNYNIKMRDLACKLGVNTAGNAARSAVKLLEKYSDAHLYI